MALLGVRLIDIKLGELITINVLLLGEATPTGDIIPPTEALTDTGPPTATAVAIPVLETVMSDVAVVDQVALLTIKLNWVVPSLELYVPVATNLLVVLT